MAIHQLVYMSHPFGFDMQTLSQILDQSRRNNLRDDITGCLVCRADMYLQLLEGPAGAVDAAYARIARDDRHANVSLLIAATAPARMFPDWAMRDDPAQSWMWTQSEVAAGAADRATPDELLAILSRIAATPNAPYA
jgi:hypothetical protein